ncbi:MAG: hypothetical protein M3521_13310, partial [Acidobacteriota bacterium]|nr:hypothetical protein [Acidobacteriota bacterium]
KHFIFISSLTSNLNLLNHTNPMFGIQSAAREFRNQRKNLVGKSADVQNVCAFFGLRVRVRLDVNADEFRVRNSGFELVSLLHRFRAASAEAFARGRVNPRFVIRNVNQNVKNYFQLFLFLR